MGYTYEFHFFGSMVAGMDMEGSDRDVNVQPTQRLDIALPTWMLRVAGNLKEMGRVAGITEVKECSWKDAVACLHECLCACVRACVRARVRACVRGTGMLVESIRGHMRL